MTGWRGVERDRDRDRDRDTHRPALAQAQAVFPVLWVVRGWSPLAAGTEGTVHRGLPGHVM